MSNNDQLTSHNIERPGCGHTEIVRVRPQQSLADYNFRVVPELREAMQKPCTECAKQNQAALEQGIAKQKAEQEAKAELAKQKLVQEMEEKAKSK